MNYEKAAELWIIKDRSSEKVPAEILKKDIEQYILNHNTCALATADGDLVRCTPIEYAYHNGCFWLFSEGGLKFRTLNQNRHVCLAIFDAFKSFSDVHGMQVTGIAEIIDTESELYSDAAKRKGIPAAALSKLPEPLNLIRVTPQTIDFLNSDYKEMHVAVRQQFRTLSGEPDPEYKLNRLTPADNSAIAGIVRHNLEEHALNIPGTAYFDPELDHLSAYYDEKPGSRAYFILKDHEGNVIGGAGLAEFPMIRHCCELQKLYLDDSVKGRGFGKRLLTAVEGHAVGMGFRKIYLETHSNLQAAIRMYKKTGYSEIPRPDWVKHSTMDRFFLKTL